MFSTTLKVTSSNKIEQRPTLLSAYNIAAKDLPSSASSLYMHYYYYYFITPFQSKEGSAAQRYIYSAGIVCCVPSFNLRTYSVVCEIQYLQPLRQLTVISIFVLMAVWWSWLITRHEMELETCHHLNDPHRTHIVS